MSDLTTMCLEDMNKLKRMKVETLVTIHVHQRDLFGKISDDAKKNMIWLTENANSKIASIGSTTNASSATRITVSKTVFA